MTEPYSTYLLRHFRHKIGANIHSLRARRKMPLHKLSTLVGSSEDALDRYELGKDEIPFDLMLKIACAFGVDVTALLK